MKLELIEETSPGSGTMYVVRNDDSSIKWFAKKEEAEAFYDSIVADPSILLPVRNILKSEKINVSLDKQNS